MGFEYLKNKYPTDEEVQKGFDGLPNVPEN